MPHYKSMMDTEWLFAFDLNGKDQHVQIERVVGGTLIGEGGRKSKKPVAHFKGVSKPLALNATNCKTIASIAGSTNTDKWIGLWITLYVTTAAKPNGEMTEAIRIRPKAPTPPAQKGEAA